MINARLSMSWILVDSSGSGCDLLIEVCRQKCLFSLRSVPIQIPSCALTFKRCPITLRGYLRIPLRWSLSISSLVIQIAIVMVKSSIEFICWIFVTFQLLNWRIFLIIWCWCWKDTSIWSKLILSRCKSVYFSFLIILSLLCVRVHPWNIWAQVVNSFFFVCCKLKTRLLTPISFEEILLSIKMRITWFLIGWLITMIVDVCVSMMRPKFKRCVLVIGLCSIEFLSHSM